jgi:hypothetical protein
MPEEAQIWAGRLQSVNASWASASAWLTRVPGKVRHIGQFSKSPYAPLFTRGATFTPRLAFVVEGQKASPLGVPQERIAVRSSRSVQEKKPWNGVPGLAGVVETEFVRPFFTGENVFPFRVGEALLAVIPCNTGQCLTVAPSSCIPVYSNGGRGRRNYETIIDRVNACH